MSLPALEQDIAPAEPILLDASTLIAYLDGREAVSPIATHIIDGWVRLGRNPSVVSMVSVMEILVRPLRQGAPEPYVTALDFLQRFPHLRAVPLDMSMAQEAAALRAHLGFSPPDALTIATGIRAQVSILVTNGARWQRLDVRARRVRVCYLSAYLPFP